MEDQRRTKRVPFSVPIEQLIKHCSDYPKLGCEDEFFEAKALNLSSGGIACESRAMIDILSQVYLIFSLPTQGGKRQIRCDGYIAHANFDGQRYVLGISFVDMPPEDQSVIDAYIDSLASAMNTGTS